MTHDDKKKDPRETYDYDKDVKYQRKPYADNDVIDRPVNQARRYEIKKAGVPFKEGNIPAEHKQDPEDFHEVPVDEHKEIVEEIEESEKERMENKE